MRSSSRCFSCLSHSEFCSRAFSNLPNEQTLLDFAVAAWSPSTIAAISCSKMLQMAALNLSAFAVSVFPILRRCEFKIVCALPLNGSTRSPCNYCRISSKSQSMNERVRSKQHRISSEDAMSLPCRIASSGGDDWAHVKSPKVEASSSQHSLICCRLSDEGRQEAISRKCFSKTAEPH